MTDINFYVSQQDGLAQRLNIVYRLVTIARQHNFSIHIHTDGKKTSEQVDKLLWIKEKQSFIPHAIIDTDNTNTNESSIIEGQINISHNYEPMEHCDYLINLSSQRPAFFSRFKKVAEILDNTDEIISAGRKRYAFYKERGYTLGYHKL